MTTPGQRLGRDARALLAQIQPLPTQLSLASRATLTLDPLADPSLREQLVHLGALRTNAGLKLADAAALVEDAIVQLTAFVNAGQLLE